jgi:hypothetical protein
MDWFLHREAYFYRGTLVQCQSYRGNYACPHGGATVSVGDGMDFSHSMLLHFMGPTLPAFPGAENAWVWLLGGQARSLLGYEEGP